MSYTRFNITLKGKPQNGTTAFIIYQQQNYPVGGGGANSAAYIDINLSATDANDTENGLLLQYNNFQTFYSFQYLYNAAQRNLLNLDLDSRYGYDANGNFKLLKGNFLLPVAAFAGLLLFANTDNKKQVGVITKENAQTGLLIAGGLIGWVILKQVLETLGILDDRDKIDLDNAGNDPRSFWNPNMWLTKPANVSYTNPITTQQAQQYAKLIYDAFGAFNDNEEQAISVFRSLPSQAAASFVSYWFNQLYRMDLLTFLRGGTWPQDRLSDADVNYINQFVNRLPRF